MDKVKQETFSNFHYEIIKSIDDRCADVKCTYTYKGKNLTHYFSYAKSGNKPSSYYISKAKADMNKIVASKSKDNVAKKDLNGKKATFFRRHKKPILIATTAVLVAGIATAATLVALKYLNKPGPESVTEAEIDEHLHFPSDEMTLISDYDKIQTILSDAICTVRYDNDDGYYYDTDDLNSYGNILKASNLVYKRFDTAYEHTADPFAYASKQTIARDIRFPEKELTKVLYNDTSEFYTNKSFKTKALNSTYLNMNFEKNPQFIKTKIINTFDEGAEDKFNLTIYTSLVNTTHKESKKGEEVLFETGTTDLNGTQTEELASVLPYRVKVNGQEDYQACEDQIRRDIGGSIIKLAEANNLINPNSPMFGTFYQKNENEVYSICYSAEGQRIAVNIPSIYYPETGVAGYKDPLYIWHFIKDDKLKSDTSFGWKLESYAYDNSIYSRYNDLYQDLGKSISVNKRKGFVEFKYDEKVDSADDVEKIKIPTDATGTNLEKNKVKAPSFPATDMCIDAYDYYEFYGSNETEMHDATIPYRIINKTNGYMLTSTIYVPTVEELDYGDLGWVSPYYYINYQSEYFDDMDYYYLTKYNFTDEKTKTYVDETEDEYGYQCFFFKDEKSSAGKYFNVTVTYEEPILDTKVDSVEKDSILRPTSITVEPVAQ